jgi:hypothetical protein
MSSPLADEKVAATGTRTPGLAQAEDPATLPARHARVPPVGIGKSSGHEELHTNHLRRP